MTDTKLSVVIKAKGITIPKLHREMVKAGAELSIATLYNALSGKHQLRMDKIKIVSEVLKAPIEELC